MSISSNIPINPNKVFDNDNTELWTDEYLIDNIFNDLMSSDSNYIHQAAAKFKDFRRCLK